MENGIIKLRTLTHKSKLSFGKYADLTVQDVINLGRLSYLRWAYFSLSKINFTDEILNEILIPDKFKIKKPGKNEELNIELSKEIKMRMLAFTKFKHIAHNRRVKKSKYISFRSVDYKYFNKESLQRKNHGH